MGRECRVLGGVVPGVQSSGSPTGLWCFSLYLSWQPLCGSERPQPRSDVGLLPLIIVEWLHIAVVMALELINDAQSEIIVLWVGQICSSLSLGAFPPPTRSPFMHLLVLPTPQSYFWCFKFMPKRKLKIRKGLALWWRRSSQLIGRWPLLLRPPAASQWLLLPRGPVACLSGIQCPRTAANRGEVWGRGGWQRREDCLRSPAVSEHVGGALGRKGRWKTMNFNESLLSRFVIQTYNLSWAPKMQLLRVWTTSVFPFKTNFLRISPLSVVSLERTVQGRKCVWDKGNHWELETWPSSPPPWLNVPPVMAESLALPVGEK